MCLLLGLRHFSRRIQDLFKKKTKSLEAQVMLLREDQLHSCPAACGAVWPHLEKPALSTPCMSAIAALHLLRKSVQEDGDHQGPRLSLAHKLAAGIGGPLVLSELEIPPWWRCQVGCLRDLFGLKGSKKTKKKFALHCPLHWFNTPISSY